MMLETRKRLIAVCTYDLAWHPDSCYPAVVIVLEMFKRGSFAPHQQNGNEWRLRAEQCFSIRVPVTLEKEPTLQQVVFLGFAAE